jgi:hypothetical protein
MFTGLLKCGFCSCPMHIESGRVAANNIITIVAPRLKTGSIAQVSASAPIKSMRFLLIRS